MLFLATRPPARPEQFTWTGKTKNNETPVVEREGGES